MFSEHRHQWTNLFHLVMLLVLSTLINQIWAEEEPSLAAEQQHQLEHVDETAQHSLQKRTWKNLQGGWGKRNPTGGVPPNDPSEPEPDYYGSYPGGGHGDENPNSDAELSGNELDKLNRYLIRGLMNQQRLAQMDTQYDGPDEEYPGAEKRAWNKMQGGWGKRVNAGPAQWNKFRGAWGKREPGWNNLKGLWGKRSEKWNKLSSSWGKRDSGNSNSY